MMKYCVLFILFIALIEVESFEIDNYVSKSKLYPEYFEVPVKIDSRIISNNYSQRVPYQVLITSNTDQSMCTGVIISKNWILTTGRCLENQNNDLEVIAGIYDLSLSDQEEDTRKIYNSQTIIIHENYKKKDDYDNDIGLIKIADPGIEFDDNIQSIEYPIAKIGTDFYVKVTGWGNKQNELGKLKESITQVISMVWCQNTYGNEWLDDDYVCTNSEPNGGLCSMLDAGAPMVFDEKIHGLGSFYAKDGCELNYPDGFTRVSKFSKWIEENTNVKGSANKTNNWFYILFGLILIQKLFLLN